MTNRNMSVYTVSVCLFLISVCVHALQTFLFSSLLSCVCCCHFCVSLILSVWSGFQMHAHGVMSVIKASRLTDSFT